MKTLQEILNSKDYRHVIILLRNKQEIEGIFTEVRLDRNSLDAGLNAYDIRHSDNNDSKPATLEARVAVNWFGTVITKTSVSFPENDAFLRIKEFYLT